MIKNIPPDLVGLSSMAWQFDTCIKIAHQLKELLPGVKTVIGGLIFGFPEDDEELIRENYEFFTYLQADAAYCQVLTPYPKTGMHQNLLDQELITNQTDLVFYF